MGRIEGEGEGERERERGGERESMGERGGEKAKGMRSFYGIVLSYLSFGKKRHQHSPCCDEVSVMNK